MTKIWPPEDYPLVPVGRLVLNRNPENYFAEVEQAAFAPASVVPGISFSPDKLLQGRIFAYPDAQRYRLGANYALIPINQASVPVCNYQRGGSMRVDANGGNGPNYEPNTSGGALPAVHITDHEHEVNGIIQRAGYRIDDDYLQAGDYYRNLSEDEKARLIDNLVDSLKHASREVQQRQLPHFFGADQEYGSRIAAGLGLVHTVRESAGTL